MTIDNIHHIRCPICGGRLFDVITGKGKNSYFGTNFAVMIKCWKCRETITLKPLNNINYLVQASHVKASVGFYFFIFVNSIFALRAEMEFFYAHF